MDNLGEAGTGPLSKKSYSRIDQKATSAAAYQKKEFPARKSLVETRGWADIS